ncbi:MAG: hypothetical protein JW760_10160 [Spirochaetales bacterium]|nr:hypothetical protein [Spirochaetales bacterium]
METINTIELKDERVYTLDISDGVKEKIRSTGDVGRSKPCIFEIRDRSLMEDLEKVMLLKTLCK